MSLKATPFAYRIIDRKDGHTILVNVPCNTCDGTGSRAIVHRHNVTQYESCPVCNGFGCTEARRTIHPFGALSHSPRMWFVLGWPNQRFGSPDAAARAIVQSMRPEPVIIPEPRPEAEVIAAVTSFESPV